MYNLDYLPDPFAGDDAPSSPSIRYSLPRSKGKRTASHFERDPDNAGAGDKNTDGSGTIVDAGGADSDEMTRIGSSTDNDIDPENHDVQVSSDDIGKQTDADTHCFLTRSDLPKSCVKEDSRGSSKARSAEYYNKCSQLQSPSIFFCLGQVSRSTMAYFYDGLAKPLFLVLI